MPTGTGVREEDEVVARVRAEVARGLVDRARADEDTGRAPLPVGARRAYAVSLAQQALSALSREAMLAGRPPLDLDTEERVARRVIDALFGLAGLQPLVDEPEIENVNVNGADVVWVRRSDGRREQRPPVAASDAELVDLLRSIAARAGVGERRFDTGCPRLSVRLPGGHRLFAVMEVTGRPCVSIRRHRYPRVTLADLVDLGTLTPELAELLAACVRARRNVLVSGGTGVGKTTLLRALAGVIGPDERLVTIEDAHELALDTDTVGHPDCVAMQAREPNIEGEGGIDLAELVRWALRMSPDRVIVGEVRGPELVPMLNAMSQGNDGSMATIHASSSAGVFTRLAAYAAQAPERLDLTATNLLVASAVHVVVHLALDRSGRRVVSSVREVTGADGPLVTSNEVYAPGPDRRAVPAAPLRASTADEMVAAGLNPALLPGGWR